MVAQPELAFPPDTALPASFDAALRAMVDRPFLAGQKWQEMQWRANREGVHPDLLRFEVLFIRRMTRLGVPMFCAEAVRSNERQADLFALGVTKIKHGGAHTLGCAMDIVHAERAWNLARPEWALLGHVGKEVARAAGLKLTWGGDWSFYDPAHWEFDGWEAIASGFPFAKQE